MYKRFVVCLALFHIFSVMTNPLVAVVLMVKNEANAIGNTLRPFVEHGIDSFFVFDTGSTDNTVAVVEQFFKDHEIAHGYCIQEPFVDFATSRNRALALAEIVFAETTFFVMPDAEWCLQGVPELLNFCKEHEHDGDPLYLVRIIGPSLDFYTARVFRVAAHARFVGVVHEYPIAAGYSAKSRLPRTVYFALQSSAQGREKSAQRWLRDKELLTTTYHENPTDPRTLFYLGQTCECLGQLHQAYEYYTQRVALDGWDEERYEALYRLGRVTDQLSSIDPRYTWEQAFDYYVRAFSVRACRAEPLYAIAAHYWPDNIPLCFLFAQYAATLPYPEQELLFVDKDLYEYGRYEMLSRCAWHMKAFNLGEQATRLALKAHPNTPHLLRNLAIYLESQEK